MKKEMAIKLYEKMLLVRSFEETVSRFRYDGTIYGAVHCCIGQEAVSVGVCMALKKQDRIIGTHRSHGLMIAKGADVNPMMAELFGKRNGTNGGRGGSLHVCTPEIGALGATGIVGSGIPIAVGSAFAAKYKKENVVSIAFLGDGASNEGVFYESLNLASKWNLPVIFVVENNGIAVTTKNTTTTANTDVYKHAESFGMIGQCIGGQDVEDVYGCISEIRDRVYEKSRPELIEIRTFRFHEHAEGKGYLRMEGVGYRDEDEKQMMIKNEDPLKVHEEKLIAKYNVSNQEINEYKRIAHEKIDIAVRFAVESEEPDINTVYDNIFVG